MDSSLPRANRKKDASSIPTPNRKPDPSSIPAADGGTPATNQCPNCKKIFQANRIGRHREVCTFDKKRPIFDARFHRVKGTQAEKYYKKKA